MKRTTLFVTALCAVLAGCQKSATTGAVEMGKAIYDQNCATCHGPDGDVRSAEKHDPKTPDLRTIAQRSAGGHIPRVMLAEIIDGRKIVQAHGSRSMPVWGDRLDADETGDVDAKIDALLRYIESIQIK